MVMEVHDIYDKNGNKTGKTIERAKSRKPGAMNKDEFYLVINVWIVNSKGEFLISKRSATAHPDPGGWQPTCGRVIAGEDSISAAIREVKEELGIQLDKKQWDFAQKLYSMGECHSSYLAFQAGSGYRGCCFSAKRN